MTRMPVDLEALQNTITVLSNTGDELWDILSRLVTGYNSFDTDFVGSQQQLKEDFGGLVEMTANFQVTAQNLRDRLFVVMASMERADYFGEVGGLQTPPLPRSGF